MMIFSVIFNGCRHEYAVISELISNCKYVGWHSPHASHAFFSQIHFFGPTAKK